MSREELALELVKAWCMQPSTAVRGYCFRDVLENYEIALERMNKIEITELQERVYKAIECIKHYESIRGYYEYVECGYDEYNYEEDVKEELLEILKGEKE